MLPLTRWLVFLFSLAPGYSWAQSNLEKAISIQSIQVSAGVYEIRASNRWRGPLQVQITLSPNSSNVSTSAILPQRWDLGASQTKGLFRISPINPERPGNFGLVVEAVPGSSGAEHQANYPYRWPLINDVGRMDQGFGGTHSHSDAENFYAIDLTAPPGTPIVASRPGKVMAVEDGFSRGGLDPALMSQANFVRILHEDGSMASYVHIAHRSARVVAGQSVVAGQQLAALGGVGYASGPHLHFVVQVNTGMELISVRFKMFQPQGVSKGL
jgi:murein DD-endopeptidase MepM/ murein hydrolase activator NlpD